MMTGPAATCTQTLPEAGKGEMLIELDRKDEWHSIMPAVLMFVSLLQTCSIRSAREFKSLDNFDLAQNDVHRFLPADRQWPSWLRLQVVLLSLLFMYP